MNLLNPFYLIIRRNNKYYGMVVIIHLKAYIYLLGIHFHDIKLKRGKSYIKSPEWISCKKATINPKNKDNKSFQYSITVALNHQETENHPKRISNIKPFIDKYNWKDIDSPAGIKDWEKFERNNKYIALNILSASAKEKINIIYKSKYNRKRKY